MLLIYFAQRDVERKRDPRRIDAQIAVELRIVERIIWQFSNFDQAVRTLKEYTRIDDYIDTSNGLLSTRGQNGVRDQKTVRNIIKMTVTKEVQETIREWMRDILAPQRVALFLVMLTIVTRFTSSEEVKRHASGSSRLIRKYF